MKVKKEPIREDRYLNIRVDTYPIEFNALDALFHDLTNFTYCVILNDGERDIILEFAESKVEALLKHKETYDRLLLRPKQWFDVKEKKFKYIEYIDSDKTEKLSDIKTIDQKDLYKSFINEIQSLIVKGSNNGLTFYTKREATDYSRKVAFCIFSGLRVKVGQLRNTSYAELKQLDAKAVDNLVKFTDKELAKRFLTNLYTQGEEHERWEMFVDLLEAKISEYYKEGDRSTSEAPNYIILEEINKEVEARVALNKKPEKEGKDGGDGGGKADFTRKTKENVTGKFYVDDKCIICDACAIAAPKFFKLNEVNAFVYSQPTTPEEIELCNQALAGCPVAAIGNDGDVAAQAAAKPAPAPAKVEAPAPKAVEVKKEEPKAIDPATIEKEIEDMKDLLGKVSIEKLNEIKALLQASVQVETPAQEVVEVASAPVEETVSAPASGGKALPATAPDGSKVFPENVAGMFYVDEKCIECNACVDIAPNFFVIDNGHAFVFAQPTNDSEIEQCKEALGGCPVGSININE